MRRPHARYGARRVRPAERRVERRRVELGVKADGRAEPLDERRVERSARRPAEVAVSVEGRCGGPRRRLASLSASLCAPHICSYLPVSPPRSRSLRFSPHAPPLAAAWKGRDAAHELRGGGWGDTGRYGEM